MNTKGERAKPMKTGHESRINAGLDLVVSLPDRLIWQDKCLSVGENTPNIRDESKANVKTLSAREAAQEAADLEMMDGEPERLGLCYFAGNDEFVKIGFSTDVGRRLGEIRNDAGLDWIVLFATVNGHRFRESYYHKRFAAHALGREWFTRGPEIDAEIERLSSL